jgi:hypothetical protein
MFIKPSNKRRRGWTMLELLLATGLFSICGLAVSNLFIVGTRSMAAMANYSLLDMQNREAMDQMTQEIRQAKQVADYSTNSITILNGDNQLVTYSFSPNTQEMLRQNQGDGSTRVLLQHCSLLSFNLYQRNPSNANYGVFPAATNSWQQTVKVIQLSWKTACTVSPTANVNSENIQTARIVIRKQQD